MKINEHGLNDTVEEIETMIKNLEQANNTISSIIIPNDFAYASNIRTIYDYIDGMIYNLGATVNWINEAVQRFREARMKNNEATSGLFTGLSDGINIGEGTGLDELLKNIFGEREKEEQDIDTASNTGIMSITALGEGMKEQFENMFTGIGQGFTDFFSNINSTIAELSEGIENALKGIGQGVIGLGVLPGTDTEGTGTEETSTEQTTKGQETVTELSNEELLNKFQDIMQTGTQSDAEVLDAVYNVLKEDIEAGNAYSKEILNKLIAVKEKYPQFCFITEKYDNSCFIRSNVVAPYLGNLAINLNNIDDDSLFKGTVYHEIGHMLHYTVTNEFEPEGWKDLLDTIRIETSGVNKEKRLELEEKIIESHKEEYSSVVDAFYQELAEKYGVSESYASVALREDLEQQGYSEEEFQAYIVDGIRKKREEKGFMHNYNAWGSVSDILDGIYQGKGVDLNGEDLQLTFAHGEEFYSHHYHIINECVANFTELKLTGAEEQLMAIKETFGEEFYNHLEEIFNRLMEDDIR